MRSRSKQGVQRRFKRIKREGLVIGVVTVPQPRNDAVGTRGANRRGRLAWANARIAMERTLEKGRVGRLEEREAIKLFKPVDAKLGKIGGFKSTITHSKAAPPRAAATYRGAKRNTERGPRKAQKLKAERIARGESRRDADRRRHAEAQP